MIQKIYEELCLSGGKRIWGKKIKKYFSCFLTPFQPPLHKTFFFFCFFLFASFFFHFFFSFFFFILNVASVCLQKKLLSTKNTFNHSSLSQNIKEKLEIWSEKKILEEDRKKKNRKKRSGSFAKKKVGKE